MFFKLYTGRKMLLHYRLCKAVLPAVFFTFLFSVNTVFAQRNDAYAYEVFETLLQTINRNVPARPVLIVENNASLIAQTNAEGQIKIGYQLIDHFRSFGADSSSALAHILSHELMHYYNNHLWGNVVGSSFADEQWGAELAKIGADSITIQLHETQADVYAMYYSFSAGYETYRIAGNVLDSTYAWYHLKEKLKGYPSKTARKEIATDAAADIKSLIPVFESSAWLMHIASMYSGEEMLSFLQLAAYSTNAILDKNIHTKEMYNNLAIANIMQALVFLDNDTLMRLQWPLITETESALYNLSGTRGNSGNDKTEKAKQLLTTSVDLLDEAIHQDNTFYPAYINKAIALLLLKKYGSCADVLDEVQSLLPEDRNYLYDEISGLSYLLKGKQTEAKDALQNAEKKGSKTAGSNYTIFSDPSSGNVAALIVASDTSTTIQGEYIGNYMDSHSASRLNRFELSAGAATLFFDTIPGGMLYDLRPKPGSSPFRYLRMQVLENPEAATDKGIQTGSTEKEIIKKYGQPYAMRLESGSEIYLYPAQNLLIRIKNGKAIALCQWWAK